MEADKTEEDNIVPKGFMRTNRILYTGTTLAFLSESILIRYIKYTR